MSDTPQGPDWWQASDDKWYPPPRPAMPGDATAAYPTAPPTAPINQTGSSGYGAGAAPGPYIQNPYAQQGPGLGTTPSPYGGVPAGPPGAGGQNRTPLLVALGVLVALATVVLLVAVTSGGDDDDATGATTIPVTQPPGTTDDTDPPGTTEGTEPSGPGGAVSAIEVADSGWSLFNDFADTATGSYGFVLENTGGELVLGAELSITIYDEAGGVVTTTSGTLGPMRAGERLGFGGDLYGEDLANGVGEIDVQVGEPVFPADVPSDGELTVSGVDWTTGDLGIDVTFTVASTYGEQLDTPAVGAVFRNSAGEIVGGASGAMNNFIPPNDSTGGEVSSIENVPEVVDIEVYVHPGGFFFG